ncbi:MAG TPA: GAF domain-containing protein [Bryobacteraceae bacterium]|nr:GAF domain-containing protein [Bryobacteraceae bacterium]
MDGLAGFTPWAGFATALLMAILLAAAASLAGALWARELHRKAQRRANRILHALSESVTSAGSPAEIAEGLAEQLPSVSEATSVRLYLYNHATKSLEFVPTSEEPDPMAIAVDAPQDGLANGVVKCFLSRSAVHVPDVRRNPLVSAGWHPGLARSAMFVPLLAQQDRVGVLEVSSVKRLGYFSREDQAAVQHLSNQVASAVKLREQRAVREQLFRSEKLAATAQLISGVAGELSEPLDRILELAESAAVSLGADPAVAPPAVNPAAVNPTAIRQIAAESRRASDILARLISFAHPDSASARAVDVNALIAGLVQFRESEWKARGLRVQNRLAPEAALAVGARGQLEQLFLNLLVHAEQCAAAAAGKTLSLASSRMGGRIVVEIHYSSDTPRESLAESSSDALGLDVCRGIAATHGGEIRVVSRSSSAGFDVDLPLVADADAEAGGAPPVPRKSTRVLTLLLVDSDAAAQRQLLGMLAARGHRVVPAPAEQAADLAPRVRFDAVFWAVRSGGPKWSDRQERIRPAVPAFVLVSDGYDRDLAASLEDSGGFLLSRPVEDRDLDRVLESVEARTAVRAPA